MSPANLDDLLERLRLRIQRVAQLGESRDEGSAELRHSGDVHHSGEPGSSSIADARKAQRVLGDVRVITALAHVNMVVGVNRFL